MPLFIRPGEEEPQARLPRPKNLKGLGVGVWGSFLYFCKGKGHRPPYLTKTPPNYLTSIWKPTAGCSISIPWATVWCCGSSRRRGRGCAWRTSSLTVSIWAAPRGRLAAIARSLKRRGWISRVYPARGRDLWTGEEIPVLALEVRAYGLLPPLRHWLGSFSAGVACYNCDLDVASYYLYARRLYPCAWYHLEAGEGGQAPAARPPGGGLCPGVLPAAPPHHPDPESYPGPPHPPGRGQRPGPGLGGPDPGTGSPGPPRAAGRSGPPA